MVHARCIEGINSDVQVEVEERRPLGYVQEIIIQANLRKYVWERQDDIQDARDI